MSDNGRGSVVSRQIPTAGGGVHVDDRPRDEPALVLMHGFADDSRIYSRLLSLLAPPRVVALDFLGYGRSERVPADVLGAADQLGTTHLPVTLILGALDRYLNPDLAAHLAGLFQKAELHAVKGASHWDQPEVVSQLIP
jgi:pimeloyl-ACP methyl ester carboxylesterase